MTALLRHPTRASFGLVLYLCDDNLKEHVRLEVVVSARRRNMRETGRGGTSNRRFTRLKRANHKPALGRLLAIRLNQLHLFVHQDLCGNLPLSTWWALIPHELIDDLAIIIIGDVTSAVIC